MRDPRRHPTLLRQLQVYCECAERLSFRKAAEVLCITPSAVSHQIRELERVLETRLFERGRRRIELTDRGRVLFQQVRPLVGGLASAVERFGAAPARSEVHFVAPPFFASELLVPGLTRLYSRGAEVDLRLDTRDPRPGEHPASADLSVLLARQQPDRLRSYPLFSLVLIPAAAEELALSIDALDSRTLSESTLIVHRSRRDAWEQWARQAGIDLPAPRAVLELDSMATAVAATERGLGLALVPEVLVEPRFTSGCLRRLSAERLATGDTYYLTLREEDARRAEVGVVTEWALEEFCRPGFMSAA